MGSSFGGLKMGRQVKGCRGCPQLRGRRPDACVDAVLAIDLTHMKGCNRAYWHRLSGGRIMIDVPYEGRLVAATVPYEGRRI